MTISISLLFNLLTSFLPYGLFFVTLHWNFKKQSGPRFLATMLCTIMAATLSCLIFIALIWRCSGSFDYEKINVVVMVIGVAVCFFAKIFVKTTWKIHLYITMLVLNIGAMVNGSLIILELYLPPGSGAPDSLGVFEDAVICLASVAGGLLLQKNMERRALLQSKMNVWLYMTIPLIVTLLVMVQVVNMILAMETELTAAKGVRITLIYVCLYGAFFVVQLISVRLIGRAMEAEAYRQRAEASEKLLELQKKRYRTMLEQNEKNRKMRHDMRHLQITLRGLLRDNQRQRALDLLDQLGETFPDLQVDIGCGNDTVSSIVSQYAARAKGEGVKFETSLNLGNIDGMDLDLAIIFGNALENAFEAVTGAAQKVVRASAMVIGEFVNIRVDNTFDGQLQQKDSRYLSRKRNFEEAGIGLDSIRTIVEARKGILKIDAKENWFILFLMVKK